ncbi:histidine phosphatase family protein [Candidatus Saccharibacteria bacterium]|nr:histidine phosphatase family protein [Candidatus Saccharibacteria bacterium]
MKLYVIRHGETPSNISGIVSGRSDEDLTKKGIAECQELNLKLGSTKFDAVYVSPVKRTIKTAEIVVPEYRYIIDSRISERELGTLKGYTIDELWQMPYWNSTISMRTPEGAETFGSGLYRVQSFLADLKTQYPNDASILLVTHSFISRCIWAITNNITEEKEYRNFSHKNNIIKIYHI